jgi:hypothetical protein
MANANHRQSLVGRDDGVCVCGEGGSGRVFRAREQEDGTAREDGRRRGRSDAVLKTGLYSGLPRGLVSPSAMELAMFFSLACRCVRRFSQTGQNIT